MVSRAATDGESPSGRGGRRKLRSEGRCDAARLEEDEGANLPCLCDESLDALSERAWLWDCVPTDLGTLAGTGEGSVCLAELVGDSLRDDVADLVGGGGGESAQPLEGEKLLVWVSANSRLMRLVEKMVDLRSRAPSEGP